MRCGSGLAIGISIGYTWFSDKRLAHFMRKVGGEQWAELLNRPSKKKAHSNNKRKRRVRCTLDD